MRTVLVIEDDQTLLEGLQIFLEMEGYRTLTSTNGRAGYELALEHNPDIILTNFQMPGADGLEVLRLIRNDIALKDTPVVFMTANHKPSLREQAVQRGADAFLRKPFSTVDLVDCISRLLQRELESH